MRVLLTGASGFIGRHILVALLQQNIQVVTVGRTHFAKSFKHINLDILSATDFVPLFREAQATHLLHLAWHTEHGEYWTSPLNLRWLEATVRLVEASCAANIHHVMVAGSCAEYDWTSGYCREDVTPLNPTTLYGVAKDATHNLVLAVCARHQVPCAWTRIFWSYGDGESNKKLVPSLIEFFQGRRAPFAINATVYRDFLHVSDIAQGFIKILTQGASGVYNVSSGEPTRLSEVVTTLASLLGSDPEQILELTKERRDEPKMLIGESLKLRELGWKPILSLTQGLERDLRKE